MKLLSSLNSLLASDESIEKQQRALIDLVINTYHTEQRTALFQTVTDYRRNLLESLFPEHQNKSLSVLFELMDYRDLIKRYPNTLNPELVLLEKAASQCYMSWLDFWCECEIAVIKARSPLSAPANSRIELPIKDSAYYGAIIEHIDDYDTIEGSSDLADEHLPVFDCAFKPANGKRFIHYMGHIRMMGAVQPFLSGAISKTVNMPKESTAEDIRKVYVEGWKLGLKAVAIYRDGSKRIQPLNITSSTKPVAKLAKDKDGQMLLIDEEMLEAARRQPHRERLPATRPSITHKFSVGGHEGYLTVGQYEDGQPGELFITMAKEGSTVGGMMDAFATSISLCLQFGVPLEDLVKKFTHQRFEPSGMTSNRDIPFAKSVVDYIFRWLGLTFIDEYRKTNLPKRDQSDAPAPAQPARPKIPASEVREDTASSVGSATQTSDKDVERSAGASSGLYVTTSKEDHVLAGASSKAMTIPAGEVLSRRMSPQVERVDQQFSHYQEDAPACDICGSITVRNGNCYKCYNCGSSLGCS